MDSAYKTLSQPGEATVIEKKSRFIAHAQPVASEQEAQAVIAGLRKRYWDASHHVFAYVLGGGLRRAGDDGEPQGSAGLPVLETLLSAGIQDAIVVVVRYFGGTLLGVGGLVRAYSQAARAGIDAAGVVERRLCRLYSAEIDYALWDRLQRAVGEHRLGNVEYGGRITAEFIVESAQAVEFEVMVANISNGGVRLESDEEMYR